MPDTYKFSNASSIKCDKMALMVLKIMKKRDKVIYRVSYFL
ncbi:hypothetical protein J2T18_001278 [Paenibacillus polymyxa]|nr:hypothetical protein [Paenibacillus polymyxa]